MFKKYFAVSLLCFIVMTPIYAEEAVFSNNETEQFKLQPLELSTKPVDTKVETRTAQSKATNLELSTKNFSNAIDNLDVAQVEIREQLSVYTTLTAQAKTEYELKKTEYKNYKKQCRALKKKLSTIEKSKKLIQMNVPVSNVKN